jgi:hypothetical protein
VYPGEQVLALAPGAAVDPADGRLLGPRFLQHSHVLRAVQAAARHGHLVVGASRELIDVARRNDDGRRRLVVPVSGLLIQRFRPPGSGAPGGELREGGGIAGEPVGLARRQARGLVLAVAVPRGAGEDAHDDLRAEAAQDPHRVFEQDLARPPLERLLGRAREAEVVGAREVLARPVQPPRRAELLRAHQPQADAQIRPDEILAAFAAREREVGGLAAHAFHDESKDLRVLVVRMRADDQQPPVRGQARERAVHRLEAAGRGRRERIGGGGRLLGRRRRGRKEKREARDEREGAPARRTTS